MEIIHHSSITYSQLRRRSFKYRKCPQLPSKMSKKNPKLQLQKSNLALDFA